jgi:hypothetical protein
VSHLARSPLDRHPTWSTLHLRDDVPHCDPLGCNWAGLWLLRHLTVGHQHRHDHHHIPDAAPASTYAELRHAGDPARLIRANRDAGNALPGLEQLKDGLQKDLVEARKDAERVEDKIERVVGDGGTTSAG